MREVQNKLSEISGFLSSNKDFLHKKIEDSKTRLKVRKRDHVVLERKLGLTQQVLEVVRQLQEELIEQNIKFINEFLTQGVNIVYPDRGLIVQARIGDRGSRKTMEFFVGELKDGEYLFTPLIRASGGGVQVLVAFLLQILVIINRGLARFVLLDELFMQVSAEYIPNLFELFRMLKEEFQVDILLISQDPRLIAGATKKYRCAKGEISEV